MSCPNFARPSVIGAETLFLNTFKTLNMKEYLFLFRGGRAGNMDQSSAEAQAHMQKWAQWMGGLAQEGRFGGAQPLISTGKQITGTSKVVTDGPFMEGKEMVGGYLICKADTYDEAVEYAKGCPILDLEDGKVEVREVQVLPNM
jgi:hypothetical protein